MHKLWPWILSALLLAAVFYSVTSSTLFQECIQKEQNQAAAQHLQQSAATVISVYRPCVGDFVHDNAEDIIACFTIILALSTIFLWVATRDLVGGHGRTAERQLRAYLSIAGTFIENYGTQRHATINWRVKNHGQTPAFDIDYRFTIEVLPVRLPDGFDFPPPQREIRGGATLFPGADMAAWFHNDRPFTEEEYDGVEDCTRNIHIWGVMSYRDAFKHRRTTLFNVILGGPNFVETMRQIRAHRERPGPGYIWVSGPKHNQAT